MLAAEIRIEISFRDFSARRDFECAGTGITIFCERLERSTQDALFHRSFAGGPIGDDGLFHVPQKSGLPNDLRTLPTAIIAQGAGIGIMVALPLLNWVIVNYSWHWAFGVLGFAGLAWAAAWLVLGREGSLTTATSTDPTLRPDRIAYRQLLLSPTIIASWCASFGAQWGLSQALSWQGAFLIKGLGFTQGSIGLLGALPAGASVILVIAASWSSQRLLARGVSSRVARGIFGGACVALGGAGLAICRTCGTLPPRSP